MKPSFGDDTSEANTSTDPASGDQKPKRVEIKKEGRQSQGRARQSCDGARNIARENNQKRRALFLTAGHMVTLNAQKMTDFAGTPIEGSTYREKNKFVIFVPNPLSLKHFGGLLYPESRVANKKPCLLLGACFSKALETPVLGR